jgi:hypothetical protein
MEDKNLYDVKAVELKNSKPTLRNLKNLQMPKLWQEHQA